MNHELARLIVSFACFLIVAACNSQESKNRVNLAAETEANLERFMSDCLLRYRARQCVCMLATRERARSVDQLAAGIARDIRGSSDSSALYEYADQCDESKDRSTQMKALITAGEVNSRVVPNDVPDAQSASASPSAPRSISLLDAPVERLITDVEACIQTQVLAQVAKSQDGSMSIAEFEEVRKNCGG